MQELKLLLITDIHYICEADAICTIPKRKTSLGKELLQRIGQWITTHQIDGIVLLGDLVNEGEATGAEKDIRILKDEFKKWNIPIIVVPGNHDGDPQKVLDIFEAREGIHELKGYQLINFVDEYIEEKGFRDFNKMENFFSQADNQKPIIVFQHNPVIPYIDSTYPYNIIEYNNIAKIYTDNKVILSVSGHLHEGIPLTYHNNVGYLTCPALCEDPYHFCILSINRNKINVKQYQLTKQNVCVNHYSHLLSP